MLKNNDFINELASESFYKANPNVFMITKNKFDDITFLTLTDSKTYRTMSIESYSLEMFISFRLSLIFYLMIDAITI